MTCSARPPSAGTTTLAKPAGKSATKAAGGAYLPKVSLLEIINEVYKFISPAISLS